MRITKPQAINLHNNAMKTREKVKEIELLLEMLFVADNEIACVPQSLQSMSRENIKLIYDMLDGQQALASSFLNGVSLKVLKEDLGEDRRGSALIDELDISDSSVRLLKRHDIYTIKSLSSFLQSRSLTELRGCGIAKAEKIEEALVKYLEKI